MYDLIVEFKIANSSSKIRTQFPVSNKVASIYNPKVLAHFYITDFITEDEDDVSITSVQLIPWEITNNNNNTTNPTLGIDIR